MPTRARKRLLSSALALVAVVALGACGSSHTRRHTGDNTGAGGVNAAYLNVDNLLYQVEVSRELNPADREDAAYLTGVPAGEQQLPPGYVWFGVFVLVLDESKHPGTSASSFALSDTQGNVYQPVTLGPENLYAYRPATLLQGQQIPAPDTTASDGPTQASLLLYRLPETAYDNRPLVLRIASSMNPATAALVTLDV